jgi:predicted dithiol-disulfide oxidoreductase (DUF899 family)
MALPDIVTREEWLAARTQLLALEKQETRRHDALNAQRRRLPMVAVDKEYLFEGPSGTVSLLDLFGGYRQLIVQHVMFEPDGESACPGCTAAIDEISGGLLTHLRSRDTEFVLISRAPLDKLDKYRVSRGWSHPWYSSYGSDFNFDFQATVDAARSQFMYNYRDIRDQFEEGETSAELPGMSCFLRDGSRIFHTYSAWARGTDTLGSAYSLLDLTALGRQEDWEEPKGRAPRLHGPDPTFTD